MFIAVDEADTLNKEPPACATKACNTLVGVQKSNASKFYKYCSDCMQSKYKMIKTSDKAPSAVADGYVLPTK
jgi:hypothetical protein